MRRGKTQIRARSNRGHKKSTLRREISRLIGGDCGCGGTAAVVAANSAGNNLALYKGGSLIQPYPAPFFSMPYNAYPINDHINDPNNPGTVTSEGQPPHGGYTGGRGRSRTRRHRRRRRGSRARRGRSNRRMSGGAGAGLMFSNYMSGPPSTGPVNLMDQVGTVSGAQTLATALIQPAQLSHAGLFSQMAPGTAHNPVYV